MGLLHPIHIADGSDAVDLADEPAYQAALHAICGGKSRVGHDIACVAVLVPEPSLLADRSSVRVDLVVHGRERGTVGHLPRSDARRLEPALLEIARVFDRFVSCDAVIVGGWDSGDGDEGDFGVTLRLMPPDPLRAAAFAAMGETAPQRRSPDTRVRRLSARAVHRWRHGCAAQAARWAVLLVVAAAVLLVAKRQWS